MSETRKQIRIGELIAQTGILPSEYMSNALSTFEERGLPIGKALIHSGYLTDQQLRMALDMQALVNDGLLPCQLAVDVLVIAYREGLPLAEAFKQSGFVQPADLQTNKLGQLLIDAGTINKKQLEESLQMGQRTGLPLGHVLSCRGFVSQMLVGTALAAQYFVRGGMLDRPTAIRALKAAYQRELKFQQAPVNRGYQRLVMNRSMKLGELLIEAGLIAEEQMLEALHASFLKAKFVGEIFIERGFVDKEIVLAAVDLQEMLDNGTFKAAWAPEAILSMRNKNLSLSRAVAEIGAFKSRKNQAVMLIELLALTGLVPIAQLPPDLKGTLQNATYNQAADVSDMLLERGLLSEHALICALRCIYLIDEQLINLRQAIMAIEFAAQKKLTVDEAICEFGWTTRTRLREP